MKNPKNSQYITTRKLIIFNIITLVFFYHTTLFSTKDIDFTQQEINAELLAADLEQNDSGKQTRSVENYIPSNPVTMKTTTKIQYAPTVFDYQNFNFYLGAKNLGEPKSSYTTTASTYSITRASAGNNMPTIKGITPQTITNGTGEEVNNDLYGKIILNLGLFNKIYPLATYQQDITNPQKSDTVYLITKPLDGTMNINSGILVDANPTPAPTQQIVGLAGSDSYAFTAASASGKSWNDNTDAGDYRGIAIEKPVITGSWGTFKQLAANNLSNSSAAPQSFQVSALASKRLISFTDAPLIGGTPIKQALIGQNVDMYWDYNLKRLFIGLSGQNPSSTTGVCRDIATNEGGCASVLVGYIATDPTIGLDSSLALSPILYGASKTKLYNDSDYKNSNRFMTCFYFDTSGSAITISAKKVRVMLTSTGYYYLIANCDVAGISTSVDYNGVFALPLIGLTDENDKPQNPALIGTLASRNNFYKSPASPDDMPQCTDPAVAIGSPLNSQLIDRNTITDLFVYGDSVFVCLNGTTNQNTGIFQSTALFDGKGIITGWTPWLRVEGNSEQVKNGLMGNVYPVYGGGVDPLSNFYFLAGDPNAPLQPTTIRITDWGKSENVNQIETIEITSSTIAPNGNTIPTGTTPKWAPDPSRNLSSMISSIFPQEQLGALQIINFDEQTPGFYPNRFSMMVAVGYNSVALIQTLDSTNVAPMTNFNNQSTPNSYGTKQNVFVNTDPALSAIAPLCFAEVARNTNADSGWLFVGGYKGIAVLCKNDGTGWDSSNGLFILEAGDFPDPSIYTFKQLKPKNGNFSYVRKLASLIGNDDSGNPVRQLFILTNDSLYVIDQTASQFKSGDVSETKINLGNLPEDLRFTDMLIIPNSDDKDELDTTKYQFIFGSTYGLLVGSEYDGTNINLTQSGSSTDDPALHLHYLSSTKGKNGALGNLYVLQANYLTNKGQIYRYYVNGGLIAPDKPVIIIPTANSTPFIDMQNFRNNFVTDGAFGISTIAKGHPGDSMTDMYQITQSSIIYGQNNTYQVTESPVETGPIDPLLDLATSNWYIGVITRNSATGAWVVPGDWGVRVNE